jgi:redox-sensitive bicupin YhaK (pirin superfamily)
MSIKIYKFEEQVPGEFNGGAILENRPIVLTEDPKNLKPYSNIFYWSHAWSEKGSTIGEHPHRAFEILSFVLKGSIEHYDSKNREWIVLKAGDVQIIRAGSGISHSEKINPGSEMFQVWFDPNLNKTISVPASYNDYTSKSFPVKSVNSLSVKTYFGEGAPIEMVSEGVRIEEISFENGPHSVEIDADKFCSVYLIEGKINITGRHLDTNDFAVIEGEALLSFEAEEPGKLFMIQSPVKLPYKTYAEKYK